MGDHIWVHIYERPYMNINERKIRCTNFGSRHRTFLAPGCQTAEVKYTVTPCFQHHQIGYKTQKQPTNIYRCTHIWTPIYGHPYVCTHMRVFIYEPWIWRYVPNMVTTTHKCSYIYAHMCAHIHEPSMTFSNLRIPIIITPLPEIMFIYVHTYMCVHNFPLFYRVHQKMQQSDLYF